MRNGGRQHGDDLCDGSLGPHLALPGFADPQGLDHRLPVPAVHGFAARLLDALFR
jgi:hypothetical protein